MSGIISYLFDNMLLSSFCEFQAAFLDEGADADTPCTGHEPWRNSYPNLVTMGICPTAGNTSMQNFEEEQSRLMAEEETKEPFANIRPRLTGPLNEQTSSASEEVTLTHFNANRDAVLLTKNTFISPLNSVPEFTYANTAFGPPVKPDVSSCDPKNCPPAVRLQYMNVVWSDAGLAFCNLMLSTAGLAARQLFHTNVWTLSGPRMALSTNIRASTSSSTSTSAAVRVSEQLTRIGSWFAQGSPEQQQTSAVNPFVFSNFSDFATNTLSPLAVRGAAIVPSALIATAVRMATTSAVSVGISWYREKAARLRRDHRKQREANFIIGLGGTSAMLALVWARNGWLW